MQGYRTYIAALMVAVFGVLAMTDWISFFNDPKAGMVAIGSAILMAVLRTITSTPPGQTKSVEPPKDE
jgi:hypothetical protein